MSIAKKRLHNVIKQLIKEGESISDIKSVIKEQIYPMAPEMGRNSELKERRKFKQMSYSQWLNTQDYKYRTDVDGDVSNHGGLGYLELFNMYDRISKEMFLSFDITFVRKILTLIINEDRNYDRTDFKNLMRTIPEFRKFVNFKYYAEDDRYVFDKIINNEDLSSFVSEFLYTSYSTKNVYSHIYDFFKDSDIDVIHIWDMLNNDDGYDAELELIFDESLDEYILAEIAYLLQYDADFKHTEKGKKQFPTSFR